MFQNRAVNRNRNRNRKPTKPKRRRTSWNGWRIVAGGVLLLIFGSSMLTYSTGPSWFSLFLLIAGLTLVIYGRAH